ncbi:accessory factor UbiK family protein [Aeromonas veronii]|uniref:hypothetical protein n=1 Tax=Aeromonas veronii TaxID=654 RepID=UPI001C5A766D|nr:hypothetical protein [Aeromonas veronii]MBW3779579.1 accessory factor UbiK family protein [Aeromonas veronii]
MAKKPNAERSERPTTYYIKWGAVLVFLLGAIVFVCINNMNDDDAVAVSSAPVEIPPPAAMPTQPIKPRDELTLSDTQRELLQKAREYKLALLTSKINELNGKKDAPAPATTSVAPPPVYMSPMGSPDDIPAEPKAGSMSSRGDDIIVKMILGTESAWLERGGERRQVRVGGTVWGLKIAKITQDAVCVGGKLPRCLYIEG